MTGTRNLQLKDKTYLWHPYTQMHDYVDRDLLFIDHAKGTMLYDADGNACYDTISSWWCILHGHNHPTIVAAVKKQLDKLDQVLLAGTTHEGAILLAEKLVRCTPEKLRRVFYSDNGSTACEIALKMSLQFWQQSGHPERQLFIGIERGYHGDTIGTMSLGGVPGFHGPFEKLFFPAHRAPSPYCYRCPAGKEQQSCSVECLDPLARFLEKSGRKVAALIIEPLIQAAGGMIIYPAKYLHRIAEFAATYDFHLIFDEVATGFGRTGKMFAMEHTGIVPDFLCLSKGLTAGFLPMAATLTSEEIYQAFYGVYEDNKTFYHGHTFTGNPLAAAAALGSFQVFADEDPLSALPEKIARLHRNMHSLTDLPWVGDLRQLGMISAIELVKNKETKEPFGFSDRVGWRIYLQGLKSRLLLRPLGNIIYLWLPISVTLDEIDEITTRTRQVLADPENITSWSGAV